MTAPACSTSTAIRPTNQEGSSVTQNRAPVDGIKPDIKPFATFLLQQAGGRTHEELTQALHDVVAAVQDTGKKGRITLVLEIALLDKKGANSTQIRVADAVKVACPEHDRASSIFWTDKNGNVTRNDPQMLDFEGLRVAEPLIDVSTLKELR